MKTIARILLNILVAAAILALSELINDSLANCMFGAAIGAIYVFAFQYIDKANWKKIKINTEIE